MSEWLEEIQEEIIPEQFWEEIEPFKRIIVLVSGGVDSTIIVNEFYQKGIEIELLWNNTWRSMPQARDSLAKIFRFTGYRFNIVYPHHDPKMITQLTRDKVNELFDIFYETGNWNHYRRNDLPCCYYLKKAPAKKWYKENIDSYDTIIITGIAGYEGQTRQQRLGELRKEGKFVDFLKSYNNYFGYPMRDYKSRNYDRPFLEAYVRTTQYPETRDSGCFTCPVPVMFEHKMIEKDLERLERCKKVWLPKKTGNDA